MARTVGSQPANRGSIPRRAAFRKIKALREGFYFFYSGDFITEDRTKRGRENIWSPVSE